LADEIRISSIMWIFIWKPKIHSKVCGGIAESEFAQRDVARILSRLNINLLEKLKDSDYQKVLELRLEKNMLVVQIEAGLHN